MLEIHRLRNQTEDTIQGLQNRHFPEAKSQVEAILNLDQQRRSTQAELDKLKQSSNERSKMIGGLMKSGQHAEAEKIKAEISQAKATIKEMDQQLKQLEIDMHTELVNLPNLPHESVPLGKTPEDNVVVSQNDRKTTFDFTPLPHWELARKHDIIDWELGVKLTGAGFPVYRGKGARLQRALITYFLNEASKRGFEEIQPPLMVNEASGYGTGQLPDKEGQMYEIPRDGFFLIPTAEVPITNLFRDEIVKEDQFPIRACGYTPCFRREAGSYGKHVKGLNRLHQFDKVEIVQIAHPANSYQRLEEMTAYVMELLDSLELQYRQLALCTGDLGFTSAKTYDLEVFSAAQERWLEVSSVSNFETFQTNRLKLRYKDENKKTKLAHSLNGSALALPRIVASLLENHQQADGSIHIPKVLQSYTGFEKIG